MVCTNGNTSNLYHHLKNNHRAIHRTFGKNGHKLVKGSDHYYHVYDQDDAVAPMFHQ